MVVLQGHNWHQNESAKNAPERLWAIGCNVPFRRSDDGDFDLDLEYRLDNQWLQQLIRKGLLAPQLAFDYDDLPDGERFVLIPVGSDVEVKAEADESGEPTRGPLPAIPWVAIGVGVASSAIWDGVKAG
jgi:hypothetical protein